MESYKLRGPSAGFRRHGREARCPHRGQSWSVHHQLRVQLILECGGSAAAFLQPPTLGSLKREALPPLLFTPRFLLSSRAKEGTASNAFAVLIEAGRYGLASATGRSRQHVLCLSCIRADAAAQRRSRSRIRNIRNSAAVALPAGLGSRHRRIHVLRFFPGV